MASAFDSRANNFDFLRLSLALCVVYTHSFHAVVNGTAMEPFKDFTHGQAGLASIAVDGFFIISGFLVTQSFLRSASIGSYFWKRVARVYPGFVVCMLLSAVLVAPVAGAASVYSSFVLRVLSFLFQTLQLREFKYVHAFAGNPVHIINLAVWTIPIEFGCYLCLAVLGVLRILKRRALVLAIFAGVLVLIVASPWISGHHPGGFSPGGHSLRDGWLRFSSMYLAGMVFYLYRERIRFPLWGAITAFCVLAIACVTPNAWLACFPIAGAYLIFWFAFHPRIRLQDFARYGDFSYGTYLYAYPIQQLIVLWLGPRTNPFVLFLIAVPLSLLAAFFSWNAVEKWFLPSRKPRHAPVHARCDVPAIGSVVD